MSDKNLVVKKDASSSWDVCIATVVAAAMMILPEASMAVTASSAGNIEGVLCNVVRWLTGGLGKAIATISIIIIGIGAMMGKVSWGMAIIVAIGVSIVFGAGQIVNILSGQSGQCDAGVQVINATK